jgi:hypothetical protein
MKANKVLKRLAKIEALMSDLTNRFSGSAHLREVLQNAKAAVTQVKKAVGSQASSEPSKDPPMKDSQATTKAPPQLPKPKRKLSEAGRKAIIAATQKRWALKRAEEAKSSLAASKKPTGNEMTPARAAKKSVPLKKATVKKAAPR